CFAGDIFPQFQCIQPNVNFWTDVYTTYSTSEGIVHDSRNLGVIYEVISLRPYDKPGSRKINRMRMKRARAKYAKILHRLARNPRAADPEAKRVAALFGDQASAGRFSRAAKEVRCQVGQKDRFMAGLIRSGAYIDQIREIFRSHGLPEDLAYLPHVESSFNLKAYSKYGAAGIWQFTRSTGKRYMEVGYVLDERRDPISATHAAARLLKDNYNKLGSWPLAITAYNHGAAGMARARSIHGSYPALFKDYRSRTFKFASRNFYSEFLAARRVASDYHAYFGDIALDNPKPFHVLNIEGYVALDDLCRHLPVARQTIRNLNPALRQPVFSGQKHIPPGYSLRLPLSGGEASAAMYAAIPESLYKDAQKPSLFYTVQRGDTAGKIARRHGVRLSDLVLANNLNRRATIYPRQTLRIPQPGEPPARQPVQPAAPDETIALAQNDVDVSVEQDVEQETPPAAELEDTVYPQPVLASIFPLPPQLDDHTQAFLPVEPSAPVQTNLEIVAADVHMEKVFQENGREVGLISVEVEETLGHYAEWANVRPMSGPGYCAT
ncbi:MAG: transglycosylase SLT domain-containing protein, partial [Desulfosarcinaceae bacterium]